MTRAKPKAKSKSGSATQDALALLKADHKAVKQMFEDYAKLSESQGDADDRQSLAERICAELTVHTQVEEELFYPALREALEETALLDEAEVEHTTAKDLIEQIRGMAPDDELYDAKVTVLGEYVVHHVKEEESEMFKQARATDLDLAALGAEMAQRRDELHDDLESAEDGGADAEDEERAARRGARR